jgi:hypothetical protein
VKDRHWPILVWILILAGVGFAWLNRHVEDDAFITFRYSQHLVEGHGPVWNVDQRVEGYTNFLWMLMMAVPIAFGIDPVLPSMVISLGCLAFSLWLLFDISRRQAEDPAKGFWAWLPLVFSHTLLIFATSGMETAFNGFLWTLAQPDSNSEKPLAAGIYLCLGGDEPPRRGLARCSVRDRRLDVAQNRKTWDMGSTLAFLCRGFIGIAALVDLETGLLWFAPSEYLLRQDRFGDLGHGPAICPGVPACLRILASRIGDAHHKSASKLVF